MPIRRRKDRHKIALLIETSRQYGRGLLEGIARFTQEAPNWSVYFEPAGLGKHPPPWLKSWNADGILARVSDPQTADLLASQNIPVIDLRGIVPNLPFPFFGVDNASVAQVAFQHFRDRGFNSFAVVGTPSGFHPHLDQRRLYFCNLVEEYASTPAQFLDTRFGRPRASWEVQQRKLSKWLDQLPPHTAIFCVDDLTARETIDAAKHLSIKIPEELAVLGVDNDEHLCTLSPTPISSVSTDSARVGYEAAQALDQQIQDPNTRIETERLIPSTRVVTRSSTDILATSSPLLAKALAYIKEHACDPVSVDQIVENTPVCRTLLEREFKRTLGRTVFKEILRVKLDRAQDLLATTTRTLEDIADTSGFHSAIYLTQVFRRELHTTPGAWRAAHRKDQSFSLRNFDRTVATQ